jgi:NAD(P)-dependent dehydrogenase (short-subunit alcohol dehydrogenase family)
VCLSPLLLLAVLAAPPSAPPAPPNQKAVLVTGASSGIGRKITERLAADGYFVYAGARKDSDIIALSAIPNVKGVRLDVTKPAEIAAAVQTVTEAGRGLYGLVNNAGVLVLGPLAKAEDADFQYAMEVNALGVLRVTRAFLPLLQAGKGRVVSISSVSGLSGTANFGVYAMTKHAVEAFTDSLAIEMTPAGVQVIAVEPGPHRSDLVANLVRHMKESPSPDQELLKKLEKSTHSQAKDPEDVALMVKRALADEKPSRRYMVTPNKEMAELFVKKEVEKLVQINGNQPYALTRDQLVALIDSVLAESKAGR